MQSVIIGSNQAGQRFDKFLHKYLPEAGSGFLYKMLRKKNITLNEKKADGKELLKEGDKVTFFFSDETFSKFSGISVTGEGEKTTSSKEVSEADRFSSILTPTKSMPEKSRCFTRTKMC